MKWNYSISTNTIWTSFDHGTVEASTLGEAMGLAKQEIKENFQRVNDALQASTNCSELGMVIDYSENQIEITPEKD